MTASQAARRDATAVLAAPKPKRDPVEPKPERDPLVLEPPNCKWGGRPTIFRVRHVAKYTVLDNLAIETLQTDPSALGLFTFLMKHPDDYAFDRRALCRAMKIGKDLLSRLIQKLESVRLARRRVLRTMNKQFAGVELVIFETPELAACAHRQPDLFGHDEWEPLPAAAGKPADGPDLWTPAPTPPTAAPTANEEKAADGFSGDGSAGDGKHRRRQTPTTAQPAPANPTTKPSTGVHQVSGTARAKNLPSAAPTCDAHAEDSVRVAGAGPSDTAAGAGAADAIAFDVLLDRRIGFSHTGAQRLLRRLNAENRIDVLKIVTLCLLTCHDRYSRPQWIKDRFKLCDANFDARYDPFRDETDAEVLNRFARWLREDEGLTDRSRQRTAKEIREEGVAATQANVAQARHDARTMTAAFAGPDLTPQLNTPEPKPDASEVKAVQLDDLRRMLVGGRLP